MLLVSNGESPGQALIDHMLRGGKVPEHLMDIRIPSCTHNYTMQDEDHGFIFMKCTKCDRTYLLEDHEVPRFGEDIFREWIRKADIS